MKKNRLILILLGTLGCGLLFFFLGFLVATGLKAQDTLGIMIERIDRLENRFNEMETAWGERDLTPEVTYIQSGGNSQKIDFSELERLIDSRNEQNNADFKKMAEEYLRSMGDEKAKTPSLNALYEVWLKDAGEAIRTENYKETHVMLNKILTLDPGYPDALALKGFSFMCENPYDISNYEKVKNFSNSALERDRTNSLAVFNKGWVSEMLKNNSDAIKFYDMALALDPGNRLFLDRKTEVLLALGRGSEAINTLGDMINSDPNNESLRVRRAESLYLLSRYEKAKIELEPLSGFNVDPNILSLRCKIAQKTEDHEEEFQILRIMRNKKIADFDSLLRLANLCYEKKLNDEALLIYNSLIDDRKSKDLDKFTRSDLLEKSMELNCRVGNYRKSYDLYNLNPDVRRAGILFRYAVTLKYLGKYEESRRVFNTLIERDYSGDEFQKELTDLDRIQGKNNVITIPGKEVSSNDK